ncbi:hypothetical protein [Polynucleobacter sp. AP-Nino-20-G2]|uniref:hypothetical protein n=1 Tax=Polynucleobacter sp. AP-Nino-20-G2 TaxID=2576917 RepID=UPI001BFE454D|nr:hypothetical protein [Polynucleobacter sp. AP-Nino-20-G2]QWE16648.1 hypothetical protein FD960_10350 [Polynucleobacter sp. AP-Nino-20-G2]
MADTKASSYEQGLMDTIMALSREVSNLRQAYEIIYQRIQAISTLADKTTGDAVKESINAEELARLSLVAANVANKAALVLGDGTLIDATQASVLTAEKAHKVAAASTITNANRQTGGGALKTDN